jgi:hypothetical protein
MADAVAREYGTVTPYLRLLILRTRRRYVSIAFGLPALAPSAAVLFVLGASHLSMAAASTFARPPAPIEAAELMEIACVAALLGSILVVSNLTAFLVHDERANGRSRLLRLATVDGRPPVVALLGLATVLATASAGVGLGAAGLLAVVSGLPVPLWLGLTLWTTIASSAGGPIGVWIGYLLPRTVAMVAVLAVSLWVVGLLGALSAAALRTGVPSLAALGWVVLAQLVTLLALPPLWRRTSARLW